VSSCVNDNPAYMICWFHVVMLCKCSLYNVWKESSFGCVYWSTVIFMIPLQRTSLIAADRRVYTKNKKSKKSSFYCLYKKRKQLFLTSMLQFVQFVAWQPNAYERERDSPRGYYSCFRRPSLNRLEGYRLVAKQQIECNGLTVGTVKLTR